MRSVTHNALVVISLRFALLRSLLYTPLFFFYSSQFRVFLLGVFPFVIFFQYVLLFSTHSVNLKSVHIVHPHFIRFFVAFPSILFICRRSIYTNSFPTNNFSPYTATLRIRFLTYESVAYSDIFSNWFWYLNENQIIAMWRLVFKVNFFSRPTSRQSGKNNGDYKNQK